MSSNSLPDINNSPHVQAVIGKGSAFPLRFSSGVGGVSSTGSVSAVDGIDKINGSISHILTVPIGSMFFQPDFGSNLHMLIFEPNDAILRDLLVQNIQSALRKWEKRIIVTSIMVDQEDLDLERGIVHVLITWNIINSQVFGNYVYPFVRFPRHPLRDAESTPGNLR